MRKLIILFALFFQTSCEDNQSRFNHIGVMCNDRYIDEDCAYAFFQTNYEEYLYAVGVYNIYGDSLGCCRKHNGVDWTSKKYLK